MSPATKPVKVEVHLRGVIAYVPDGNTLWALMPNALLPTPAQWAATSRTDVMRAYAPHVGLLLFSEDQLHQPPTARVNSTLSPFGKFMERKALAALVREQLVFDLPTSPLIRSSDVDQFLPHLGTISKQHEYVDRRFLPTDAAFQQALQNNEDPGLTAAFQMATGTLSVKGYFKKKINTRFGRVKMDAKGGLSLHDVNWQKPIANHLIWEAELPPGVRTLTIENHRWDDGAVGKFVLTPRKGSNKIEMEIMHAEVEMPALALPDPILPKYVRGLPDPDFEILYSISKNRAMDTQPRHVPIPKSLTGAGTEEKPCTGGRFTGFA